MGGGASLHNILHIICSYKFAESNYCLLKKMKKHNYAIVQPFFHQSKRPSRPLIKFYNACVQIFVTQRSSEKAAYFFLAAQLFQQRQAIASLILQHSIIHTSYFLLCFVHTQPAWKLNFT